MTDLEISKALALAIGWERKHLFVDGADKLLVVLLQRPWELHVFDYRDWSVIGPIAERYGCFPIKSGTGWWSNNWVNCLEAQQVYTNTPQKAIALAVIEARK